MTYSPAPEILDPFRAQLEPAYRHIGVAAVSHAAFEARMNQLLESLEPDGEPFPTTDGRSYLPRRNMEMSRRLDALVTSNAAAGQLQAQLVQLQAAEQELRNLRNSVVHSFVSDPDPDNPNVVYFEDARTELGPDRVKRNVQELWEATVRITGETVILGAIAGVIFDRIFATFNGDLDTNVPAVGVNSIDPEFPRKFTEFVKKGRWLGWSAGGDEPDPDWWLA